MQRNATRRPFGAALRKATGRSMGSTGLRSALVLLVAAAMVAAPASAGTSANAEIRDESNDATPLSRLPADLDTSGVQEHSAMYDILGGYVASETRDTFTLVLQVRDIDAGLANAVDLDLWGDDTPYVVADYHFRFVIHTKAYDVLMHLASFKAGGLETNYSVSDTSGAWSAVAGSVDLTANTITVTIDKTQVDDPKPGERLTSFWASAESQGILMDAAPDAEPVAVTGEQPTDPSEAQPNYGADYEFGQYEGAWPPDFSLTVRGASSAQVRPGETASFPIQVANQAAKTDTILLTLQGVPDGWTAQLSFTSKLLTSGSDDIVVLDISPNSASARSPAIVILRASSTLGDMEKSLSVTATRLAASGGGGGGGGGSSGSTGGTGGSGGDGTTAGGADGSGDDAGAGNEPQPDDEQGSPGIGLAAAVGVLGLIAVLRQRRRHRRSR